MSTLVVSFLCAAQVPTAPALKPEANKTLDTFQGKWSVTEFSTNANRVPADVLDDMALTVSGDRFDLTPGLLATGQGDGTIKYPPTRGYTYWVILDPTASPPRIDLHFAGSDKPHVFRGIYHVDGDRLMIAYAKIGDRPSKLSTGGRPELTVIEFRRAKKKD